MNDAMKLKQLRDKLGYTQEQFAGLLNMSVRNYKRYEAGTIPVKPWVWTVLKDEFGEFKKD